MNFLKICVLGFGAVCMASNVAFSYAFQEIEGHVHTSKETCEYISKNCFSKISKRFNCHESSVTAISEKILISIEKCVNYVNFVLRRYNNVDFCSSKDDSFVYSFVRKINKSCEEITRLITKCNGAHETKMPFEDLIDCYLRILRGARFIFSELGNIDRSFYSMEIVPQNLPLYTVEEMEAYLEYVRNM